MTKEQIIIIANVLSLIGNALFTSSSLFHSKKKIIAVQSSCHLLNSGAALMVNAYSGASQDGIMLLKNIILLFVDDAKKRFKLFVNVLCIILALSLGIVLNILLSGNVWYGYFPVIGMFIYSVCSTTVFVKDNLSKNTTEVILKVALIINGICQSIYGILVRLYPNTIFNGITIIISTFSIIRIAYHLHKQKNDKEEEEFEEPIPLDEE